MATLLLVALEGLHCLLPTEVKVYDVRVWARTICSYSNTEGCQLARSWTS
jgi:hypothetical protein